MKAGVLCVVVLAAGCMGGASSTSQAMEAAEASHRSAVDQFDYLLFLGVTGTEGPLNWTSYQQALRASSDPGRSIADAFDQDVENGDVGDGRLGSWLSTHFVFDEGKRLLGGLYTQYTPEHGLRTVYAPFRGPYPGTVALPGLQQALPLLPAQAPPGALQGMAAQPNGTVLCGLVSHTDEWEVDSQEAARIALQRPLLAQHVSDHPQGEFTYYYFPRLDVEPGCPAELDVQSNHWTISHADLDAYLEGGSPTIVEVRIDAGTGEVLSEAVRPLFSRPPSVFADVLTYDDPLLGATSRFTQNTTFVVEEGSRRLDINAVRVESPSHERQASTRVLDPTGNVAGTRDFREPVQWYKFDTPSPGPWTFEYVHEPLEPYGRHEVQVRAIVHYS